MILPALVPSSNLPVFSPFPFQSPGKDSSPASSFFFSFIFISWRLITLQYCSGFAIHRHKSAMDLHVFPIPIPPPTSLPTPSLWVFPVHQPQALVSLHPYLKQGWRQWPEGLWPHRQAALGQLGQTLLGTGGCHTWFGHSCLCLRNFPRSLLWGLWSEFSEHGFLRVSLASWSFICLKVWGLPNWCVWPSWSSLKIFHWGSFHHTWIKNFKACLLIACLMA